MVSVSRLYRIVSLNDEYESGSEHNMIKAKSSSSYFTTNISRSATISLNTTRRFSNDPHSVMWWEFCMCFKYNLIVKLFVMHNCSSFNHNAATVLSFNTFWRMLLERWRCICERTFPSLHCFSSVVQVHVDVLWWQQGRDEENRERIGRERGDELV